ncbi:hypothetical protein Metho_0795 [Methanomethylovorans hollandica DSM 15978]|uniref:DUF424 domain-containing protein n=1 Tax=Methanomethylovorans hollandica (strain DSM 15978 / NBRC 107637 / DMS1) TaxID=867904 RepID=L0KUD1_METHD|nr:DUF424 family protein [Methanomethylovorans hollandica]AGB49042.1 hypothetical protein Metho_0795 [Methanomethylovorans hollandica DSM 15978]
MYMKVHISSSNVVVAICDKEVLGKTLKEGNITVTVNEEFFYGETVGPETVEKTLRKATTANLFGEKCIQCAVNCGVVDPKSVIIINGVPHAQVFRV